MMTFEEFERQAKSYNTVPIKRTILADLHTPVSAYLALREPGVPAFLFESGVPDEKIGRYSFIGVRPTVIVKAKGKAITVTSRDSTETRTGDIFTVLRELSAECRQGETSDEDGFSGGFVGYIGYDCVRHLERVPLSEPGDTDPYDAIVGLFPTVVRFDHRRNLVTMIVNVLVDDQKSLRLQFDEAEQKLEALELKLRNATIGSSTFVCDMSRAVANVDQESFQEMVSRAKRYIFEGDIFQVVLSRRLQVPFNGDPFPAYRALRLINPSPYLFYVDFGDTKLIGSSPEVLVRVHGRQIELLPIAGTRRRGKTAEEDDALEADLLKDEKELAEHVMLVDLGRNDVGRVSELGAVHVPTFKKIERYSHVMHIVSTVHGTLKPEATSIDALTACFPAGTVSGAPKVRAMEIINELEPTRRGIYAGAVGYLGFNGALDTCIAIRTIIAHRQVLSLQTGAGVVADSVPEKEYQETAHKAQALIDAVTLAKDGLQDVEHLSNRIAG
jgi:anthranilate synthase component 1